MIGQEALALPFVSTRVEGTGTGTDGWNCGSLKLIPILTRPPWLVASFFVSFVEAFTKVID
jgi:hypothetical protein